MAVKQTKPFAVKGQNVVSPKGETLWCKVTEPDRAFNAKGIYSVDLVCDPNDATVQAFIARLEDLRDTAYNETAETLGAAKAKQITKAPVFKDHYDADGEETGKIVFKFKMSNVDDRDPGSNKIIVVDASKKVIQDVPLVGNGSIVRCAAFANPYYIASTKAVGISLLWTKMQIIDLNEYSGGGDDFDDEEGYTTQAKAPEVDFGDEVDF